MFDEIIFRFVQPDEPGSNDPMLSAQPIRNLCSLDLANTSLPDTPLWDVNFLATPRMGTIAIAYLINKLVHQIPEDSVYLNVGVFCGFSFFAGIVGNDRQCIGVDNFCGFPEINPRSIFYAQYSIFNNDKTAFYEQDFKEYFKTHNKKIGFYFYDGGHTYEEQKDGLEVALPYITNGGYILIDDTNQEQVERANNDFLKSNPEFKVLFSVKTANNCHPTWWDGISLIQKSS